MPNLDPQLYPIYQDDIVQRIAALRRDAEHLSRDIRPYSERIAQQGEDFNPEVMALYEVNFDLMNAADAAHKALCDLARARDSAARVQAERAR
jgi:hypothetical protein